MVRYLEIEGVFGMVQWQRYSPLDLREKVQDLGKKKLMEFFKDCFRYQGQQRVSRELRGRLLRSASQHRGRHRVDARQAGVGVSEVCDDQCDQR